MNLIKLFIFITVFMLNAGAVNKAENPQLIPRAAVTFYEGSSNLTIEGKRTLRNLIQDAKGKGIIQQVTVAAWSDKNLPTPGERQLDSDRLLASSRGDSMESFLKSELLVQDVILYNMSESTNWLARAINAPDKELISIFGKAGASQPIMREEVQAIKNIGGPSKGVALVTFTPSL